MTSLSPPLLQALHALLGDRFSTSVALREQHGLGEAHHAAALPAAVAFAETTAEVSEIVKLCASENIPVIAFGAGTSLEGHLSAVRGGVSIDLSRMSKITRVSVEDLDCTVEAGVTR